MSIQPIPHLNEVEHLRFELEAITSLVQVCADSLNLASVLELSSTADVLQMAADRAFEATGKAKALEAALQPEQEPEQEDAA